MQKIDLNDKMIFSPFNSLLVNPKYAMSGLPAGPYTVKNLKPVDGMLYSFEYACANNSLDFLVAAYNETGLSTLSSVEYGTFLLLP